MVGEVDDLALPLAVNRGVRRIDKAGQALRQPVIAARLPTCAVHPLLHDDPMPVVANDEAVQVEGEPVLHSCAVDLGDEPAGCSQCGAIETDSLTDRQ